MEQKLKGATVTFLVDHCEGSPPDQCPFCGSPQTKKKRTTEQHYTCGLKLEIQSDRFVGKNYFYQLSEPVDDDDTPKLGEVGMEYYGCRKAHKKISPKRINP